MSIRILIALVSITLAGASSAQPPETVQGDQLEQLRGRMDDARERLNLTDEQTEQLRPILRQHLEAVQEVLAERGIDLAEPSGPRKRLGLRGARRLGKQLDKVRAGTLAKVEDVLEPDQVKAYKKIQAEWKAAIRKRIMARR